MSSPQELHPGIYTNAQLAEWFQIKLQTFKNTKKQKLAILTKYAEFEELPGGKIQIIKILDNRFVNYLPKNPYYPLLRKEVLYYWQYNTPETPLRVAAKIMAKYGDLLKMTKEEVQIYVEYIAEELFVRDKDVHCEYRWAKMKYHKDAALTEYTLFAQRDRDIYNRIFNKHYLPKQDNLTVEERLGMAKDRYLFGSWSAEQAFEHTFLNADKTKIDSRNDWLIFMRELSRALNCDWVARTYLVYWIDPVTHKPWSTPPEEWVKRCENGEFFNKKE